MTEQPVVSLDSLTVLCSMGARSRGEARRGAPWACAARVRLTHYGMYVLTHDSRLYVVPEEQAQRPSSTHLRPANARPAMHASRASYRTHLTLLRQRERRSASLLNFKKAMCDSRGLFLQNQHRTLFEINRGR